jgi:uncharacterized membrane protein
MLHLLHPVSVHFAVVLPLIALILGLVYLLKPSEALSKISTGFIVFAAISVGIAYLTGKEDGSEVYKLLSAEGKLVLQEHANLGKYLAIAMGLVAAVNLFGFFKKIYKAQLLSIVLLAAVVGGVFFQGQMGGEITYVYGGHVKDYAEGRACLVEQAMDE